MQHLEFWMIDLVTLYTQVLVTGFVPYLGKALNILLLSWIYAYYCFEYVVVLDFDLYLFSFFREFFTLIFCTYCCSLWTWRYKWAFSKVDLVQRLNFFESNWAFFAGFGMLFVKLSSCFYAIQSDFASASSFPLRHDSYPRSHWNSSVHSHGFSSKQNYSL